jgi:hypothetical protein
MVQANLVLSGQGIDNLGDKEGSEQFPFSEDDHTPARIGGSQGI